MRLGAMRAGPAEGNPPTVGGGKLRSLDHGDLIDRKPRHVVQPIDGIAGKKLKQPLLDHAFSSAAPLFGRLEDEMHRTGKIPCRRQMPGGSDEHCGMSVM